MTRCEHIRFLSPSISVCTLSPHNLAHFCARFFLVCLHSTHRLLYDSSQTMVKQNNGQTESFPHHCLYHLFLLTDLELPFVRASDVSEKLENIRRMYRNPCILVLRFLFIGLCSSSPFIPESQYIAIMLQPSPHGYILLLLW